jgi:hypothetical protein
MLWFLLGAVLTGGAWWLFVRRLRRNDDNCVTDQWIEDHRYNKRQEPRD